MNAVGKHTIQFNAERNVWVLRGPFENYEHKYKEQVAWMAGKQLTKRWQEGCYRSELRIFKKNGGHQQTRTYGDDLTERDLTEDRNSQKEIKKDLAFIREIKEYFDNGESGYANELMMHWICELEELCE